MNSLNSLNSTNNTSMVNMAASIGVSTISRVHNPFEISENKDYVKSHDNEITKLILNVSLIFLFFVKA